MGRALYIVSLAFLIVSIPAHVFLINITKDTYEYNKRLEQELKRTIAGVQCMPDQKLYVPPRNTNTIPEDTDDWITWKAKPTTTDGSINTQMDTRE